MLGLKTFLLVAVLCVGLASANLGHVTHLRRHHHPIVNKGMTVAYVKTSAGDVTSIIAFYGKMPFTSNIYGDGVTASKTGVYVTHECTRRGLEFQEVTGLVGYQPVGAPYRYTDPPVKASVILGDSTTLTMGCMFPGFPNGGGYPTNVDLSQYFLAAQFYHASSTCDPTRTVGFIWTKNGSSQAQTVWGTSITTTVPFVGATPACTAHGSDGIYVLKTANLTVNPNIRTLEHHLSAHDAVPDHGYITSQMNWVFITYFAVIWPGLLTLMVAGCFTKGSKGVPRLKTDAETQ